MTEARVQAERTLAREFQQYAPATRLAEWAGQIIGPAGEEWFGGVELRPATDTAYFASLDVQQLQLSRDLVQV